MNAHVVYKVAKALSKKEQVKLLSMLQKDIDDSPNKNIKKKPLITRQEADAYIYQHVFCKVK